MWTTKSNCSYFVVTHSKQPRSIKDFTETEKQRQGMPWMYYKCTPGVINAIVSLFRHYTHWFVKDHPGHFASLQLPQQCNAFFVFTKRSQTYLQSWLWSHVYYHWLFEGICGRVKVPKAVKAVHEKRICDVYNLRLKIL